MRSTSYRTTSGIVVTLLLLALVALIAFTLLRTPSDEIVTPETTATPAATSTSVFADTGIGNPPTSVVRPGGAQAVATPAQAGQQEIAAASTLTTSVVSNVENAGDASGSVASGSVASGSVASGDVVPESAPATNPDPAIAITLQPTPTRRSDELDEELGTMPAVDPEAAPDAGVVLFANPNFVADVAWAGRDLWIATTAGARFWAEGEETTEAFSTEDALASAYLRGVATCPLDAWAVVFAGQAGLEVVDSDGVWRSIGTDDELPFANLLSVACTEETLAVGSATRGVALYDFATNEWQQVTAAQGVLQQPARVLAFATDGSLWVASGAQVAHIVDGEIETIFDAENSPLTGEAIASLAVSGDGALWITTGDRLFRHGDDAWETFRANDIDGDYPQNPLTDLQPADDGRVWLLSQTAEICRFDSEMGTCVPWTVHDDGSSAVAVALAVAANSDIAYATAGAGAERQLGNDWQQFYEPTPFPASNRIFALASDSHGWLWAATNGGVQRVNPGAPQQATLYTAQQGMAATSVRTLFADKAGGVWLGGSGASHFDGATWTNFSAADGLTTDAISAITQDSQSRVWFGTRSGLSIWTGSTFFNLMAENGLPDAEILSLAADAATVWIGSAKGGLYRFENNQLQVLTQENVGLPSNRITALLAMPDGTLYVGTDKGLVHFVRGEFVEVRGIPAVAISALALAGNGDVEVGTTTRGTWRLPANAAAGAPFEQLKSDDGALPGNVRSLAVDLYGGIWIGTDGAGVTRLVE